MDRPLRLSPLLAAFVLALGLGAARVVAQSAPATPERGQATPESPGAATALRGGRPGSASVVIFLHGSSARLPPQRLAERVRAGLDAEARRAGLSLLLPVAPATCTTSVPFQEPAGEAAVLQLLEEQLASGRVRPERVTLAGIGAGGTAALILASRHPRCFAAVAAWSATPPPLWDLDAGGRRIVVGLAPDPIPGLRGVPVWLFTATDDPILDLACRDLFVQGMQAAAARDRAWSLTWVEGLGGHGWGTDGPREGLAFLSRQRRALVGVAAERTPAAGGPPDGAPTRVSGS